MRSDDSLPDAFRDESQWIIDPTTGAEKPEFERFNLYGAEFHKHPYSGHERNKLFLNDAGRGFVDISGICGADAIADSRSWVRWDFDKDGRADIAVVNANTPLLRWFRNNTAEAGHRGDNKFIALRFQGANTSARPSMNAGSRDGFGSRVIVETGALRIEREHVCGEGYAAHNSATMVVGIGRATEATVTVHWPGGLVTGPVVLNAGDIATCREIKDQGAFVTSRYSN